MKKKISITRALKELKTLDERIQRASTQPFVAIQKGNKERNEVFNNSGKGVVEVTGSVKANYDKVISLMAYRQNLKALIVKSNAETQVRIAGVTMPVCVAIELKTSIALKNTLLANMINQMQIAQQQITNGNNELDKRIENQMTTVLGKEKTVITAEQRTAVAKPMEDAGKLTLIDPMNLGEKAQVLMDETHSFISEVDFCLSEANAKTEIEVDDGEPEPEAKPAAAVVAS